MRKAKSKKSKSQNIRDWNKANAIHILYAGVRLLIATTYDYFEIQDTAFSEEQSKTIAWAFKYFNSFLEKLQENLKNENVINQVSEEKYLIMLSEACRYNPNSLGFDRTNERERQDSVYYEFIYKSVLIFEALLKTNNNPKDESIKKYFKMVKIQMRSICKIFEYEMTH